MTTKFDELCQELETIWHQQIPLSAAMRMQVVSFDGVTLITRADLEPNINVHGTAFAGSLYALQALTGWGQTHLQLRRQNIAGAIVIATGNIEYKRPLSENIVVPCRFEPATDVLVELEEKGRVRFPLATQVTTETGKLACRFRGEYAVKLLV